MLYKELRIHVVEVFRRLAEQKESRVEEGHLMPDHVHMMLRIPPKLAVSQVVSYIKGKSAIHLAREYTERKRNFVGQHFGARGCFVSTVGRDEAVIRDDIRNQEKKDERLDQLQLLRYACHLQVAPTKGSALAPPPAALSGSHDECPRRCRGIVTLADRKEKRAWETEPFLT